MTRNQHAQKNKQKPETDNQMARGVPAMEGQQKKYNSQGDIKALMERDCEMEMVPIVI